MAYTGSGKHDIFQGKPDTYSFAKFKKVVFVVDRKDLDYRQQKSSTDSARAVLTELTTQSTVRQFTDDTK
jgi:hypothetical protein